MSTPAPGGSLLFELVLWSNLGAVLLWFLFGGLRRGHDRTMLEIDTFLTLLGREEPPADPGLTAAIAEVRERADKGRGLGPLWGRRHAQTALVMARILGDRWPEVAGAIWDRMDGVDEEAPP